MLSKWIFAALDLTEHGDVIIGGCSLSAKENEMQSTENVVIGKLNRAASRCD